MEEGTASHGIGKRIARSAANRGIKPHDLARLTGFSPSYVSRVLNGGRAVEKRSTLETFAAALRMDPDQLVKGDDGELSPSEIERNTTLTALRVVLADNSLGDPAIDPIVRWESADSDLRVLNEQLRPTANYSAIASLLAGLIPDLNGHVVSDTEHGRAALEGLADAYTAAVAAAKNLGASDLAQVAAFHLRGVADRLSSSAYIGLAEFMRAQSVAHPARRRALVLSSRAADDLQPLVSSDDAAAEMFLMLHLTSAMQCAALDQGQDARAHFREAELVAERIGSGTNFGSQAASYGNCCFWRVHLAVELGDGGRVREYMRDIDPSLVDSRSRRAGLFGDVARGLASEEQPSLVPDATSALTRAEELAPQRTRGAWWFRETTLELLRQSRRASDGEQLRGLAQRAGVTP